MGDNSIISKKTYVCMDGKEFGTYEEARLHNAKMRADSQKVQRQQEACRRIVESIQKLSIGSANILAVDLYNHPDAAKKLRDALNNALRVRRELKK